MGKIRVSYAMLLLTLDPSARGDPSGGGCTDLAVRPQWIFLADYTGCVERMDGRDECRGGRSKTPL